MLSQGKSRLCMLFQLYLSVGKEIEGVEAAGTEPSPRGKVGKQSIA